MGAGDIPKGSALFSRPHMGGILGGRQWGKAKARVADCSTYLHMLQWKSLPAGADPICVLPCRIIPLYLIYRPSNNIPYATMEEDLGGPCQQYCVTERNGSLVARGTSEIVLKCCTFQHWVYQWTNGNILVTDMEGKGISSLIPMFPYHPVACKRRRKNPSLALLPLSPRAVEPSSQGDDLPFVPVPVLLWAETGCPPFHCRSGLEDD